MRFFVNLSRFWVLCAILVNMLKKILQQALDEGSPKTAVTSAADGNPSGDASTYKSLEDQLRELDEHLSQKLKEKEQAQLAQQANPTENQTSGSTPGNVGDLDSETKEFIQLADFISKERSKKSTTKNPEQTDKIGKMVKYQKTKTNEFDTQSRQKGLQINKAA